METKTQVNLTLSSYLRYTLIANGYMFSIQAMESSYSSRLMGGFMGLAPPTAVEKRGNTYI